MAERCPPLAPPPIGAGPVAPTDPEPRLLATRVGEVAVAEEGVEGAPLLLCVHGLPGTCRDFRYLAPRLAGSFRVARVEMPGFGSSPEGAETLAGWADAVVEVAEALAPRHLVLTSHSFSSGALLLAAPRLHDILTGMLLVAPMGLRRHSSFLLPQKVYGVQAALMALPPARPPLYTLAAWVYRHIGLTPPDDWREVRRHLRILASVDFAAIAAAVRRIAVPVLVVHSRDDRMVETTIGEELVARLRCGELMELAAGGHHLQKTRAAELAAAVVERFAM